MKDARVHGMEDIGLELGIFDTILLLGVNLGLLQNVDRATECLRRFTAVTTEQGRVVAGARDPYGTDDPLEFGYQRGNRERGGLPGENRLRVRYRNLATPWFEWLTVSKDELESIAASSGWSMTAFLDSDYPLYVAILQKQPK